MSPTLPESGERLPSAGDMQQLTLESKSRREFKAEGTCVKAQSMKPQAAGRARKLPVVGEPENKGEGGASRDNGVAQCQEQ